MFLTYQSYKTLRSSLVFSYFVIFSGVFGMNNRRDFVVDSTYALILLGPIFKVVGHMCFPRHSLKSTKELRKSRRTLDAGVVIASWVAFIYRPQSSCLLQCPRVSNRSIEAPKACEVARCFFKPTYHHNALEILTSNPKVPKTNVQVVVDRRIS